MKRITLTFDARGFIQRICADEAAEVYIVSPHVPHDRVYRWSSTLVGKQQVDEDIQDWPVPHRASAAHRGLLALGIVALPAIQAVLAHESGNVRYHRCRFLDIFLSADLLPEILQNAARPRRTGENGGAPPTSRSVAPHAAHQPGRPAARHVACRAATQVWTR